MAGAIKMHTCPWQRPQPEPAKPPMPVRAPSGRLEANQSGCQCASYVNAEVLRRSNQTSARSSAATEGRTGPVVLELPQNSPPPPASKAANKAKAMSARVVPGREAARNGAAASGHWSRLRMHVR